MFGSSPSPAIPVPAATILLLRNGDDGLEVLMIERHSKSSVGSGALVFPGGKIDSDDRLLFDHCAGSTENDDLLPRVAAIREAYEEARILLARSPGSHGLMTAEEVDAFNEIHVRGGGFLAAVRATGITLATDLLIPAAHWITPLVVPKRFDTRFFIALAPPLQIAREDGFEAVEAIWTTPQAALDAADRGHRYLMVPTFFILRELGRNSSSAAALDNARRRKIIRVVPEVVQTATGVSLNIPPETGYDLEDVPWSRLFGQRG